MQLFGCNLNTGQNIDDVWSLLEAVRAQSSSPGGGRTDDLGFFLWTPLRAAASYDYVWGVTNSDLVSSMEGLSNFMGSAGAEALGPRFQSVNEHCDSMIALSEQVAVSATPVAASVAADRMPDGVVETFSCRFKDGADMNDVRGATTFWQEQVAKIDSPDQNNYNGYLVTPLRGGTGEAEWGWIGTYPDLVSFGRAQTDYMSSKQGQAADERFAKVSTCRSALWTGYWVLLPQADSGG